MTKEEAAELSKEWKNSESIIEIMEQWDESYISELSNDYLEIRKALSEYYDSSLKKQKNNNDVYSSDLDFALNMYELFRTKYLLTSEMAADDGVWRYLQMKVIPGIVFSRWEGSDLNSRINDNRFWKDSRRMWVKSLWWYVHLSLCENSIEKTRTVLATNSTDSISQLVERPGSGYRVDLCRAIMYRFSKSPKKSEDLLRKVMKMNTACCTTIEPLLVEEGIEEYVNYLFEYFGA